MKMNAGDLLKGTTYKHPVYKNRILHFLPGSFATATKGTGLVHTAPAHGPDDFLIALEQNIAIVCLVDKNGCYKSEAGEDLVGLPVLDAGNSTVISKVANDIVFQEDYVHSYPYDWRTKQPVIIRANKQWFIDTNAVKDRAVKLLEEVSIYPKIYGDTYRRILISQLKKRPYWCISRQRCWGVPIPVFYAKDSGETIISEELVEHFCALIDQYGADYWWTLPLHELFPQRILTALGLNLDAVERGKDILDIWFDSGLSWSHVLDEDQIADLYLEGVDQFTGWFQSSLMISTALRDQSPYKAIYVHGFAVDKGGLKMSKSLGNVIDPIDIIKLHGIDTLRWWVVCHACANSQTHVTDAVLSAACEEVQKIRGVLRFALGALADYAHTEFDYNSLPVIDKYMLHLIWRFDQQMRTLQDDYHFTKVSSCVINFVTTAVSALYYTSIKDRLYCNEENDAWRRAAQYVLYNFLGITLQGIAPIVPHLAEEFHAHAPFKATQSFFLEKRSHCRAAWNNAKVATLMEDVILNIKKGVNKAAGASTLDLKINIKLSSKLFRDLEGIGDPKTFNSELEDVFQVSQVDVEEDGQLSDDLYSFAVDQSGLHVCNRCRKVASKSKNELCNRCAMVVNDLDNKNAVVN